MVESFTNVIKTIIPRRSPKKLNEHQEQEENHTKANQN
jgi:hypothetical protein